MGLQIRRTMQKANRVNRNMETTFLMRFILLLCIENNNNKSNTKKFSFGVFVSDLKYLGFTGTVWEFPSPDHGRNRFRAARKYWYSDIIRFLRASVAAA